MANTARSSYAWQRAAAEVKRTQTTCHLCGLPIPQDVDHQRSPLGFTVDHLDALANGGDLTHPGNLRAAHRTCNSRRNARPLTAQVYAECRAAMGTQGAVTSRQW